MNPEDQDFINDLYVESLLADFDQELDNIAHGIWPVPE